MKTSRQALGRTIIAVAVAGAFAPAFAQSTLPEPGALVKPDSYVSAGVGLSTGNPRDRAIFGQYNGLRDRRANLLLDLEYVDRNDANGQWTTLRGRDLGLETPELGFS